MSKREEYGLEFRKISSNGKIGYNCTRKNGIVDENNLLQFIGDLDINGAEFLLREINSYIDSTPNSSWTPYESMALEHVNLVIDYPNLVIDEQPSLFPLIDIKLLLEEWLEFLQS